MGVVRSIDPCESRRSLGTIIEGITILRTNRSIAERYAEIAADLEESGRMIPSNDIWIAAAALDLNFPLATRDAHSTRVKGLNVLRW